MKGFQSPQNASSELALERKIAEQIQRYGICTIVLNDPGRTELHLMKECRIDSQFCWEVALAIKGLVNRKLKMLKQNHK